MKPNKVIAHQNTFSSFIRSVERSNCRNAVMFQSVNVCERSLRAAECMTQTGNTHLYGGGGGRLNHSRLSGGRQADGLRSLHATEREKTQCHVAAEHHGKPYDDHLNSYLNIKDQTPDKLHELVFIM